ncbi:alpha/beta fold hydrolase [Streptomyces gibsoniae]|uniref:Alpha/beta hydrolase n=1 Tax=Streptomyces gibsoniae TaxID=3075529 RepID=A0ABU2U4X3_9ACTN|nr:alpha/beta hydrolase [Streptomyces sp. DSM 41699]MDT0468145.1 alpha/beta hydrolase [Streptomyces sp. DSM 41699]
MTDPQSLSRRGLVAAGAAALAVGVTGLPAHAATAGRYGGLAGARPTVVLVHGAFADGSSWSPVIERLQYAGYSVRTLANPLRGLAADAAHVRSVLSTLSEPVVLAGHSYGGAVITEAAAGISQVKALVYVSAFVPDAGEILGELSARFPGSQLQPALTTVPTTAPDGSQGLDLYIRPEQFQHIFAQDLPESSARLLASVQRPLSASAFTDKTSAAAWRSVPSWNLISTQDRVIAPELQRFQAERAGSRTVQIASSHLPLRSHPGAVATLIESAARTVAAR